MQAHDSTDQKRLYGQFFTISNPFQCDLFHRWKKLAIIPGPRLLEPFAGGNNILQLASEAGISAPWDCFDISPSPAIVCGEPAIQRDTLADFPTGYRVAITNPPYLAKNSATRRGMPFPETAFDDLYQVALERMLSSCEYVAAIIPASFLTQRIMQERLFGVCVLTCRMFEDTGRLARVAAIITASEIIILLRSSSR